TAFNQVFGMDPWEFFRRNPDNGATFNRAMTDITGMVTHALVEAYDFSRFRKIVDVGGGHGTFLAAILKATPHAEGIVFDAPEVAEGARQVIGQEGLAARCQAAGGDFFAAVPEGADAYLLKWIIHDWEDEKAVAILKNCRKAIHPGGRLILFESILAEGNEPDFAKLMDLNMLVMTGGRERTEAQYKSLLERAGFRLMRAIKIDAPSGVIEAEPA
ncbi:MAG: methyltransferase, partial [Bryobacteraceae bacterium]